MKQATVTSSIKAQTEKKSTSMKNAKVNNEMCKFGA